LAKAATKAKKSVEFLGTSRKDLKALPKSVRFVFAYAIYMAEYGEKHPDAKALTGFGGAGVMEVVEDREGDAYRYFWRHPLCSSCLQEEIKSRRKNPSQRYRADH
jgi:phage-related protein